MRKDILIKIINGQVLVSSDTLGISSENLQGRIIFKPEPFVDGICRMYVEGKGSILMDKQEDYYTLNILSSLLTSPYLDICFKITEPETEDGIPIFCSKIMHFKVLDTIDSSADIPEEYPSWEQVLDSKVTEIDNKLSEVTELQEDLENKVENGYFKGDKGEQGNPGYTPVKGVDYWTLQDKQEIIDDVLAEIEDADEEVF